MNQAQALAKLRKIIGPRLGYRVDPKAPNAEQREAMRAVFAEAKQRADMAEAARVARLNELLTNDALYQQLKHDAKTAIAEKEKAAYGIHHKRISVGVMHDLFFSIRADGDNWADVVAKVTGEAS